MGNGPRRLRRSNDRQIAGVAAGIAEYFGIDPVIARLGFVVALFAGGAGLVAYLAAWVLLPKATETPVEPPDRPLDRGTTIAVLAVALAVWIAIAETSNAGVLVPLILLGVGGYLLYQRPDRGEKAPQLIGEREPSSIEPPSPSIEAPSAPPPPRPPASVTRASLSILALLVAGAIVTRQQGWIQVDTSTVIALGLLVVGLGAIVGSFIGRARGLIAVGVLLSLAFASVEVIEPVLEDGVGERLYRPKEARTEVLSYSLGVGELVVDLREIVISEGAEVTVEVEMGIGRLLVQLPDNVDLKIEGDLRAGELTILGQAESGMANNVSVERDVEGDARLLVLLDMGIGEAEVVGG